MDCESRVPVLPVQQKSHKHSSILSGVSMLRDLSKSPGHIIPSSSRLSGSAASTRAGRNPTGEWVSQLRCVGETGQRNEPRMCVWGGGGLTLHGMQCPKRRPKFGHPIHPSGTPEADDTPAGRARSCATRSRSCPAPPCATPATAATAATATAAVGTCDSCTVPAPTRGQHPL